MKKYPITGIAVRIWLITSVILSLGFGLVCILRGTSQGFVTTLLACFVSLTGSIPALVIIMTYLFSIRKSTLKWQTKFSGLLFIQLLITTRYGLPH